MDKMDEGLKTLLDQGKRRGFLTFDQVNDYLEKNYNKETSIDQAVTLAIECIYLVSEDKHGTAHIKTAVIDAETKKMRRLTVQEIGKNAGSAKTRSDKPPAKIWPSSRSCSAPRIGCSC